MNENIIGKLTELDVNVTKHYPELAYEGVISADEDEMDYVEVNVKGAVIA